MNSTLSCEKYIENFASTKIRIKGKIIRKVNFHKKNKFLEDKISIESIDMSQRHKADQIVKNCVIRMYSLINTVMCHIGLQKLQFT